MKMWHPWRTLHELYTDITVHHLPLPAGHMGATNGHAIVLDSRLTQAERRSTLTHELIHLERQGCEHPGMVCEERIVDRAAARRLVPLDLIVDAFRWHPHPCLADLADHWWVDEQTALCRMETLDPVEVATLEHDLDGDWSWIPPTIGPRNEERGSTPARVEPNTRPGGTHGAQ